MSLVTRALAPLVAAAALTVSAFGCGGESGLANRPGEKLALPPSTTAVPSTRSSHVFVLVLENRSFEDVVGNPQAPFLNGLTTRGALATDFHGVIDESLPNYLALTGGSTFGVEQNCDGCHFAQTSIVDQLESAGISWKAYVESLPGRCFGGGEHGGYVKRHNPFLYYDRVVRDPARCAKVVPLRDLVDDIVHGDVPTYAWISPNLCNDGHSCPLRTVDRFAGRLVPFIEQSLGPRGYLVVTWDEGSEGDRRSCCGGSNGGRIPTFVEGPDVKPGFRYGAPLDQYSTLKTIERSLGLPPLRHAAGPGVKTLDPMFKQPPRLSGRRR